MAMTLDESVALSKRAVEKGLGSLFVGKKKEAVRMHPQTSWLVDAVAGFTLSGGKKLRPFLCWMGYQLAHGSPVTVHSKNIPKKLLQAMMAIELLQSFALIHDDILDEDLTRRGEPTVHEMFKKVHGERFTANKKLHHFGESMAILAGDLALAWADECMGLVGEDAVVALFEKTKEEMILGQSLDVLRTQMHLTIDKNLIDTYKTAYYTLVRPMQLGVLAGGGKEKLLHDIELFGVSVGRAFQLRDDYLDKELSLDRFNHQSAGLVKESMQALASLDAHESAKQILEEFVRFVVTRQS
jgi:geranylgeranyl diphosphate synthase type I